MEQYVDPINHVLYISESWNKLIEYVVAEITKDLKKDLKLRDDRIVILQRAVDIKCDKIVAMQNAIDGQWNAIMSHQAQVEVLHKENTNVKTLYNSLLEASRTTDTLQTILQTEIIEVREENHELKRNNAELKEFNDNQAKTIAAMMCCGGYNISPFGYRTP